FCPIPTHQFLFWLLNDLKHCCSIMGDTSFAQTQSRLTSIGICYVFYLPIGIYKKALRIRRTFHFTCTHHATNVEEGLVHGQHNWYWRWLFARRWIFPI